MFSYVTPINCCWHCPLEMRDSALALLTLTRRASSLLCQQWGEGVRESLWHCIYMLFECIHLWQAFLFTRFVFYCVWCFCTAWQRLIMCRVYGPPKRYLLPNSFPVVSVWAKVLLGHCCSDQYKFMALIYWVGFAENRKPMDLFNWIPIFWAMDLSWWLSSLITHCPDFETEPREPFHKRLIVLQTWFQSKREQQTEPNIAGDAD